MRWMWVAWACCLLPVLAGCGSTRHAVSWVTGDTTAPRAGIASAEARRTATAAWPAVTAQHPQRAFTDEFRDGFVDGYADAIDRGASAQAPAVPPVPYERYKKYFGPDGHALVQDYYLGFQYGTEAAPARRPTDGPKSPAAPKLASGSPKADAPLPRPPADSGKFGDWQKTAAPARTGGSWVPDAGDEKGIAVPPLPKPELPVIKPFSANLTDPEKFAPLQPPNRLAVPNPPLPTEELKPVVPVSVPAPEATPFPVLPPPGPRPGTSSDFSVLPPPK